MSELTLINDNVFGTIKLSKLAIKFVNTPEFQRLRYVNRSSLVQYVYPSATHSVFVSSIGRYHLARKLIESLKLNKQKDINESDIKCLEIAALCSDIAAVSCRYFWDRYFERINNNALLQKVDPRENFREVFMNLIRSKRSINENIDNSEIELIVKIVKGERDPTKPKYLFQIVYNKETRMDITMWESLCRDNVLLGLRTTNFYIDVKRFILLAKICNLRQMNGNIGKIEKEICYRYKESHNIMDTYRLWANVHETAYRHRVVESIELLLFDLFDNHREEVDNFINDILNEIDGDFYKLIRNIDNDKRLFNRELYFLEIEGFKYETVSNEEKIDIKKYIKELPEEIRVSFIDKVDEMSVRTLNKIGYYNRHSSDGFYITSEYFTGIKYDLTKYRILVYYTNRNDEHRERIAIENYLKQINWHIQNEKDIDPR